MILPIGSIVNALAIVLGSLIGLGFGAFLPEAIRKITFQMIGLFTLVLGTKMAMESNNLLLLLLSLIIGAIIGEIIHIEKRLERLSNRIKAKFKSKNELFSEGLITAFLLYCIGSLTFVGAIEEGIHQDRTLLYTKSMMDGITSILLASTFGSGVLFSAIPLLLFQTLLTWGAYSFEPYLQEAMITEISAVGGVLILALGLNILKIQKIKVSNLLPAILIVIPLYHYFF